MLVYERLYIIVAITGKAVVQRTLGRTERTPSAVEFVGGEDVGADVVESVTTAMVVGEPVTGATLTLATGVTLGSALVSRRVGNSVGGRVEVVWALGNVVV